MIAYYYTRDHLGSVREMLNGSGAIVARYAYGPYGRSTLVSGSNLATKQYTGDYCHAPSGLDLTWYRAYDSNTSRWISTDPSGENGGVNLYKYVGDNPVSFFDPDGLKCSCAETMAEKSKIIAEAERWNKTSKGWWFDNQCGEQAAALVEDLENHGLGKCWFLRPIGGYTYVLLIIQDNHNIVQADPLTDPKCCPDAKPFTLDPFHGPQPGHWNWNRNVPQGLPNDFRKEYPNPLY